MWAQGQDWLRKQGFCRGFFFLSPLFKNAEISTLCIITISLFFHPFLNLPFLSYHLCTKWHQDPPDWARILRHNWILLSPSILIRSLMSYRFSTDPLKIFFFLFSASAFTSAMVVFSLCCSGVSLPLQSVHCCWRVIPKIPTNPLSSLFTELHLVYLTFMVQSKLFTIAQSVLGSAAPDLHNSSSQSVPTFHPHRLYPSGIWKAETEDAVL